VSDLDAEIRYSVQPRFKVEIAIVQMTKMEESVKIDALLDQIEELKKKINSGSVAALSAPAAAAAQPQAAGSQETYGAPREHADPAPPVTAVKKTIPSVSETRPKYTVSVSSPVSIAVAAPRVADGPQPEPAPAARALQERVTIDIVKAQWQAVVDDITSERINVGSMVGRCTPLEIVGDTLQVACPDQYHASSLLQYKDYLTPLINKFYSSRLSIEPVVHMISAETSSAPGPLDGAPVDAAPAAAAGPLRSTARTQAEMDHPIVKILFRDFEADPL
jgi:hypothetical protein